MTTQQEALRLALEALKENQHLVADNERHAYVMEYNSIIEKCEEALAQPQRKPLTDEQIQECWYRTQGDAELFARAIEAAHGIGDKK